MIEKWRKYKIVYKNSKWEISERNIFVTFVDKINQTILAVKDWEDVLKKYFIKNIQTFIEIPYKKITSVELKILKKLSEDVIYELLCLEKDWVNDINELWKMSTYLDKQINKGLNLSVDEYVLIVAQVQKKKLI